MFIQNTPELLGVQKYHCASPPLKNFLISHNICPIYSYVHKVSKKNIWVFIMCKDLSFLLNQWSNNKPVKEVFNSG